MSVKYHALLLVRRNGTEEFLPEELSDAPMRFPSRASAERQQIRLLAAQYPVRSIRVVPYPGRPRSEKAS